MQMFVQAIKFLCLIIFLYKYLSCFASAKNKMNFHPNFFNAQLLEQGELRGSLLGDFKFGALPRLQIGTQLALDVGGLLNLNFKHHMFEYNSGKSRLSCLGGGGVLLPGYVDEAFNQGIYGKESFLGTLMTSRLSLRVYNQIWL